METESWRIKIHRWFCGAKNKNLKGTLIGVLPKIIIWRVWTRRCEAQMEDKMDPWAIVWLSVRLQKSKLVDSHLYISPKEEQILEAFQVTPNVSITTVHIMFSWKNQRIDGLSLILMVPTEATWGLVVEEKYSGL